MPPRAIFDWRRLLMGFRIYKRKSLGRGLWIGASKSGFSVGRRGGRRIPGSFSLGRRGAQASLRVLPGVSYVFRRRKS